MLIGNIESIDSLTLLFVVTTGIGTDDDCTGIVLVIGSIGVGVGLTDAVEILMITSLSMWWWLVCLLSVLCMVYDWYMYK